MKKEWIYVAGPITDNDPEVQKRNIKAGIDAAAEFRRFGYVVICPHEMGCHHPEALDYEGWIDHGLAILPVCDVIAVLPGWEDSSGVRREIDMAETLGIRVLRVEHMCPQ